MGRPICFDLFCGLGGWSEGFIAEGYDVIGFDIERHDYGTGGYPGQLVLQDVLTLHGSQFKDAACIVASPPCQEFSYMAMPWKRAKQIAAALRGHGEFPEGYRGSRTVAELTALFDACFRIQREACEAAGRHIPMVVENVKGAQPWVGRAKANYGSFYLWGDVAQVGGRIVIPGRVQFGVDGVMASRAQKFNPDGTRHGQGSWFAIADSKNRGSKNGGGGSWFAVEHGSRTSDGIYGTNPVRGESVGEGRKVPGLNFHEHEKTGKPGRSFQSAAVKMQAAGDGETYGGGFGWDGSAMRTGNSKSPARKAASAQIAKIPFALSQWVARVYRPEERAA